jgi:hypothetical protein
MAYKKFRPDLMGRIATALHDWPSYHVSIREMAKHLGGQDWTQIEECFDQAVKGGQLEALGEGVDAKYYIKDHIVPWRGKLKPTYQARCPRCQKPIQGRHGRRNRQHHDDDKCDFDTTRILING